MSTLALVYLFLQNYLVPFLFTIGLFYFMYGIIEYFIIGAGDEGRASKGRKLFLKAIGWFLVALIAYSVIAIIGWLSTWSWQGEVGVPGAPRGGIDIDRSDAVLPVPNVPQR